MKINDLIRGNCSFDNCVDSSASANALDSFSAINSLPEEIIFLIYSYADIASLGFMCQTHRGILSRCAVDDRIWASLVQRRFHIQVEKSRPKLHGGKNWKDAYRVLSYRNLAPKCRHTRKIIFAKSEKKRNFGGKKGRGDNRTAFGESCRETALSPFEEKMDNNCVSVWVLLRHTEDCRTRRFVPASSSNNAPRPHQNHQHSRFIEFAVCLQNVKSCSVDVELDLLGSSLNFMDGTEHCISEGLQPFSSTRVAEPLSPRIIYRSRGKDGATMTDDMSSNLCRKMPLQKRRRQLDTPKEEEHVGKDGITLRPFEFCVVTMPFRCGSDLLETDVLARTLSLTVPIKNPRTSTEITVDNVGCENDSSADSYATAYFLSENDIWQYYDALPGGYLTLSERFRLPVI